MRVPQLPPRLWWDHNAYYHRWVLRQLPARPQRALDVGCGSGRLAQTVASRAVHVDAVDRSAVMLDQARRCSTARNLTWIHGDLLDGDVALVDAGYDAVTAVASVHHMPLDPALARLAALVRPGGVLAVVGLYRPATATDLALEGVAVSANAAVAVTLAVRGRAGKPDDENMPVLPPTATLTEIRAAAAAHLPGAVIQRGLFWRYLLTWHRE